MSSGGVISGQEYGWTFCHWKPGSCHGQMRKINNPYDRTGGVREFAAIDANLTGQPKKTVS